MPRADIRTQSNSDFGKSGTTFPWGDLDYPRIVLTMDPRQNQTKKAFLSAYDGSDAANWTSTKLVSVSSGTPGDNQQNNVTYVWERLPGVELIRKGYDQESGAPTRVVRQRVALPTAPTVLGASRVFDTITMYAQDSYVEPESEVVGTLVTVYQQLPTTILTTYDNDEETLVSVKTTYQVVALSSISAPSSTTGIIINYKKIDSQKALKITRDFTNFLAFTYAEQRFSADTFPALFDYTTYEFTDTCGAFSNIRSSFSAKVQTQIAIAYSAAVVPVTGLTLIPKTLQLGRGVQISANVLVDAGSFTYVGACTGTVTWDASSPDYTTYITTIQNTFQVVAGESTLWKALIWRTLIVSQLML